MKIKSINRIITIVLSICIMLSVLPTVSVKAAIDNNVEKNAIPVYRLYNPNSGEHFYTLNSTERDNAAAAGWRYEGIGWYAPVSSAFPVYRLFNPNAHDAGSHHYTMSAAERDNLVSVGWKYEGMVFYSYDTKAPDCIQIWRSYNANDGGHNYTNSKAEYDNLEAAGWKAEGVGLGAIKHDGTVDPKDCVHEWATGTAKEYVPEEGYIETYYIPGFMEVQSIYRGYDHCGCGKLWDTAEQAGDCHGHWSPRSIKIGEYNPNSDLIGKYIKIDEYTYTENIYDPDNKIWHDVTVVVSNTGAKYKKWEVDKKAYYKDVTYTYCTKCGKGTYHPTEGHLEKVVDQKGFEYISHPITDDGSEKQTLIFWCPFCSKKYTQAEVDKVIKDYNDTHTGTSMDYSDVGCMWMKSYAKNGQWVYVENKDCAAEHMCWKYKEVKKTFPEQSHKVWVVDKKAYTE